MALFLTASRIVSDDSDHPVRRTPGPPVFRRFWRSRERCERTPTNLNARDQTRVTGTRRSRTYRTQAACRHRVTRGILDKDLVGYGRHLYLHHGFRFTGF
jgi:hypothetical protein